MIKRITIIGAGSAAREILQIIKDINAISPKYHIRGFLSDLNSDIKKQTRGDYDVIGGIEGFRPDPDDYFVVAIAQPESRKKIIEKIVNIGAKIEPIIHPSVLISDYSTIGKGLIAYPHALIGPNVVLGDYVFLQRTSIGHDAKIGSFVTISSLCGILGGVHIDSCTFIGNHVTILQNLKVGSGAFVGAGSVVIGNIKPGTKVFGNPARPIKF